MRKKPSQSPIKPEILQNGQIVETVSTGQAYKSDTGQIVIAEGSQATGTRAANPTWEYVASQPYFTTAAYLRALSFAIDDITKDFGDDLYDRMMLDSQVAADIATLKDAILADEITVQCPVKRFSRDEVSGERTEQPDWQQAQEMADFVTRQIPVVMRSAHELLDALAYGNKVAEKVYDTGTGQDTGKIVLKTVKVKPRRNVAFIVDPYKNIVAIMALIPGLSMPIASNTYIGDVKDVPNLLPRSKFVVLTCNRKDGDPRGQSLLRPAYDPWYVKQQIKQERLRYLATLAGGMIVGTTAEGGETQGAVALDGTPIIDSNGNQLQLTPEMAMMNAMTGIRNGAAAAFPYGSTFQVVFPPVENPFDAALDRQDREITTAILHQTRATHEAQHGSRADSGTAQDILGLIVKYGKRLLAQCIQRDIVQDLIEYNYPPELWDLAPTVSLDAAEAQDTAELMTAVAALKTADYFTASQLPDVDAEMGVPVRVEGEQTLGEAQAEKIAAMTPPAGTEPPAKGTGEPGAN